VNFRHHRRDPPHVEVDPARASPSRQALIDVALYGLFPEALVGRVDGKLARVLANGHAGVGQDELTDVAIQRESAHAVARGQHDHRRRAIQRVARRHLLDPGLQEIAHGGALAGIGHPENREDRPDRNVDVDVRRAVEGIEEQKVFPARVLLRDRADVIELFRGHGAKVSTPLVAPKHEIVSDDIQLLLGFPLHIRVGARLAEHADQVPPVDRVRDRLAGKRDIGQETCEIPCGAVDPALLLDDELGEGRSVWHGGSLFLAN
jgi:hypothetical protein